MPVSEIHHDAEPLVRLSFPGYTGHVGHVAPRGVDFIDGVAQNGVTEATSMRLRGSIGPAMVEVGPWLDAAPAPPAAPALPVTRPRPARRP